MRPMENRIPKGQLGAPCLLLLVLALAGCDRSATALAPTELMRATVNSDASFDKKIRCTGGGFLEVQGSFPGGLRKKRGGPVKVNATINPERCRWTAPEGEIQVDGAPKLVLHAARELVGGIPAKEITGTLKGKAKWTVAGQTVHCHVDASFRIHLDQPLTPTLTASQCEQFLIKRFFLLD